MRPVASYVRELRRALPAAAFARAPWRLLWLPVHIAIIILATTAMATGVVPWPLVPVLSLVIGLSFAGLTFLGHETLHGSVVQGRLLSVVGWLGFLPFVISPRLWVAWHNRAHHTHTNEAEIDPDAFPTAAEYRSGWFVRLITNGFAIGRGRWIGLSSLVFGFTVHSTHMVVTARAKGYLSPSAHRIALAQTALGVLVWAVVAYLVGPLVFLFAYVLPLLVGNALVMAFILTNHGLSPLTAVNDPLANALTVTAPRWFEWLTMRFGYHVEHHLFPAMSPRHALLVRDLIEKSWPDRYQSMPLLRALLQLHRTSRVYEDAETLVDPGTGRHWPTLQPRRTGTAR